MSCTCYGGNNPRCEEHGKISAPAHPEHPEAQIVAIERRDKPSAEAYDALAERLKVLHRELRDDGQHPTALILISIDEQQRIFCPMILNDDGAVKDVLPSVFEVIAQGLRKRTVQ